MSNTIRPDCIIVFEFAFLALLTTYMSLTCEAILKHCWACVNVCWNVLERLTTFHEQHTHQNKWVGNKWVSTIVWTTKIIYAYSNCVLVLLICFLLLYVQSPKKPVFDIEIQNAHLCIQKQPAKSTTLYGNQKTKL